ncbi:endonuclease/exonuclease/phosphatase family protein [Rhabdochromatium marinum]|uniref:endonuclease/exonuclease/phosphatase family protein n=1 Tax=Rhabdochromatium marinum TaxID=48729 RepID=UPI0019038E04|nr:endonuclease/exonuclease/phosphatase family protein [Rhabdochromatium marinum]MBK1649907.1 hypothetical protein [Rhabdochromatium marinum]
MLIATWNLNNRVGKQKFHSEAADAAIALDADIVVFTEFFPGSHLASFQTTLEDAGWPYQLISEDTGEISNRILIVSKFPLERLSLDPPAFDKQFPANLLCTFIPSLDLSLIGVRVPAYYGTKTASMLLPSWSWLEETAQALKDQPSIILGDLNVSLKSPKSKGGDHFRRILENDWHRAEPTGRASYFGHGNIRTEIDHIIGTKHCSFFDSQYVEVAGDFTLAGKPNSISDHAALVSRVIQPF